MWNKYFVELKYYSRRENKTKRKTQKKKREKLKPFISVRKQK